MEKVTVSESAGAPTKKGSRWLVTVARPGKGASGTYPEEVLKTTGPLALPAGTKAFFNHNPLRDVRDMVGTYDEGAFWNEDEGELQAYLTPFPRYQSVLEEAGQHVEVSLHAAARKDHTGIVRELMYDRGNTIDLVGFAGLEGSKLKYQVESLFASAAAEVEQEKEKEKENNVDIEKAIGDLTSSFSELSAKFDTIVAEKQAVAQGVADEAAVEKAVQERVEEALAAYAEKEQAIEAADILAVQKESLKEAARKGEDITEALASAVSFVAEARKELAPDTNSSRSGSVVIVNESANDKKTDFKVGRWSA